MLGFGGREGGREGGGKGLGGIAGGAAVVDTCVCSPDEEELRSSRSLGSGAGMERKMGHKGEG